MATKRFKKAKRTRKTRRRGGANATLTANSTLTANPTRSLKSIIDDWRPNTGIGQILKGELKSAGTKEKALKLIQDKKTYNDVLYNGQKGNSNYFAISEILSTKKTISKDIYEANVEDINRIYNLVIQI